MPQYKRKLEIQFDAFQMTHQAKNTSTSWPAWISDAMITWPQNKGAIFTDADGDLCLRGYLGVERIDDGDWIVKPMFGTLERYSERGFPEYFELIQPVTSESK